MRIQHNIGGINSHRNVSVNKGNLSKTLEKLSSGYRIVRAGDDAAGLANSENLRALIAGLTQADINAADGIGLLQTAEGAMQEISDMLQRMHQLSIKAVNGTYTDGDRHKIQMELDELKNEITRITSNTKFNGISVLLEEEEPQTTAAQGEDSGTYKNVFLPEWVEQRMFSGNEQLAGVDIVIAESNDADFAEEQLARGIDFSGVDETAEEEQYEQYEQYIAEIGTDGIATEEELVDRMVLLTDGEVDPADYEKIPGSESEPAIDDKEEKEDTPDLPGSSDDAAEQLLQSSADKRVNGRIGLYAAAPRAGVSSNVNLDPGCEINSDLQFQIGPSTSEVLQIRLPRTGLSALNIKDVSVATVADAQEATVALNNAINHVAAERGRMGGYEDRLEHTRRNLAVTRDNEIEAESRIRDADVELEFTNFTKENILLEASQSVLAQANTLPEMVLNLLHG